MKKTSLPISRFGSADQPSRDLRISIFRSPFGDLINFSSAKINI
jgi:hypothetical protein